MAEGFWEQAVETYLTIDRGVFLNPQYLVGEPGVWEGCPDFLAISFPDKMVWMVEVTAAPASKLYGKITIFESEYAPRIRGQVTRHKVIPEAGDAAWNIGLWIFAPEKSRQKIKGKLELASVRHAQVTALEETTFPVWEDRFR